MTAVAVEIAPRPVTSADTTEPDLVDGVEVVADLDSIVETVMCSCQAGDDQPY